MVLYRWKVGVCLPLLNYHGLCLGQNINIDVESCEGQLGHHSVAVRLQVSVVVCSFTGMTP